LGSIDVSVDVGNLDGYRHATDGPTNEREPNRTDPDRSLLWSAVRIQPLAAGVSSADVSRDGGWAMFNTVVVGADDSTTARQAVVVAADIAKLTGGTLHIVTAYDPKSVRIKDLPDEFRYSQATNPADVLLEGLALIAKERGLESRIHPAAGRPAEVICQVAEQEGADLVVVGNKGMTGARRVLGSVPNSVAHHAPCSVLVVDTHEAD
jgi:nucleotide-binding universal stress UspA family protein